MPSIKLCQEIEVNIDVYCATCGAGLCHTVIVNNRRETFSVPVCQDCMAKKDEEIEELKKIIETFEEEQK